MGRTSRYECARLGLDDDAFLRSMVARGAWRLEAVAGDDSSSVFYDFAHAPSKPKLLLRL